MRQVTVVASLKVNWVWNVMAHAQKPDFGFRWNGQVHLNRRGRQFSRLLAAEVCASVVVMLDTPCSEVVWRVLATHSIRQFPLYFPSRASPCAITFRLDSTLPEFAWMGWGISLSMSGLLEFRSGFEGVASVLRQKRYCCCHLLLCYTGCFSNFPTYLFFRNVLG